jgi:hypothetical protein
MMNMFEKNESAAGRNGGVNARSDTRPAVVICFQGAHKDGH